MSMQKNVGGLKFHISFPVNDAELLRCHWLLFNAADNRGPTSFHEGDCLAFPTLRRASTFQAQEQIQMPHRSTLSEEGLRGCGDPLGPTTF